MEESKEELEKKRLHKENEKLDLELKNLRKKWLFKPQSWTGVLLPALASIITVVYAISTDFFGIQTKRLEIERAELNRDIKEFRAIKDTLSVRFEKTKDSLEVLISEKENELDSLEERLVHEQRARRRDAQEKQRLKRKSLLSIPRNDSLRKFAESLLDQNFDLTSDLNASERKTKDKQKRLEELGEGLIKQIEINDSLKRSSLVREENVWVDIVNNEFFEFNVMLPNSTKGIELNYSFKLYSSKDIVKYSNVDGIQLRQVDSGFHMGLGEHLSHWHIFRDKIPSMKGVDYAFVWFVVEIPAEDVKYFAKRIVVNIDRNG